MISAVKRNQRMKSPSDPLNFHPLTDAFNMYVCLCNAITEREVRHAIQLGARKLGDLQESLGVATCCGKCADCARGILAEERNAQRSDRREAVCGFGDNAALQPSG